MKCWPLVLIFSATLAHGQAAKMKCNVDEFQQMRFCTPASLPLSAQINGAHLYTGQSTKQGGLQSIYMRAVWSYSAESWLFARQVQLLIDGKPTETIPLTFARDVGGGTIFERADIPCDTACLVVFRAMANAKVTKIRFSGDKGVHDTILSPAAKQAILTALTHFSDAKK